MRGREGGRDGYVVHMAVAEGEVDVEGVVALSLEFGEGEDQLVAKTHFQTIQICQ